MSGYPSVFINLFPALPFPSCFPFSFPLPYFVIGVIFSTARIPCPGYFTAFSSVSVSRSGRLLPTQPPFHRARMSSLRAPCVGLPLLFVRFVRICRVGAVVVAAVVVEEVVIAVGRVIPVEGKMRERPNSL